MKDDYYSRLSEVEETRRSQKEQQQSLAYLLNAFQHSLCENIRDKIYGLLSLSHEGQGANRLLVNYGARVEWIYFQVLARAPEHGTTLLKFADLLRQTLKLNWKRLFIRYLKWEQLAPSSAAESEMQWRFPVDLVYVGQIVESSRNQSLPFVESPFVNDYVSKHDLVSVNVANVQDQTSSTSSSRLTRLTAITYCKVMACGHVHHVYHIKHTSALIAFCATGDGLKSTAGMARYSMFGAPTILLVTIPTVLDGGRYEIGLEDDRPPQRFALNLEAAAFVSVAACYEPNDGWDKDHPA
jgi:hypothetical protein